MKKVAGRKPLLHSLHFFLFVFCVALIYYGYFAVSLHPAPSVRKDKEDALNQPQNVKSNFFNKSSGDALYLLQSSSSLFNQSSGEGRSSGSPLQTATSFTIRCKYRVFPQWPLNQSLPCFHPTDNSSAYHWTDKKELRKPAREGMFFLKLLKTASSTGSSVHLRIVHNLASQKDFEICKSRHLHGWAGPRMYRFGERDRTKSFLWSLVRDPTDRAASEFYHFEVSRKKVAPTDENFIHFLRKGQHQNHHYLNWLSTRGYQKGRTRPTDTCNGIMNDYDFIGVSERMDESVVALMMILHLRIADVLHISSKRSGEYDDGAFQNQCFKIQPKTVSPGVQRFFESDKWKEYNRPELELYMAVNRSLDLTIKELGPDFNTKLAQFRRAQLIVEERCASIVTMPCSRAGERIPSNETNCLSGDSGCAFDCLDRISTELGLWDTK